MMRRWKVYNAQLEDGSDMDKRGGHASCRVGSKMYIAGGYGNEVQFFPGLNVLDLETLVWTKEDEDMSPEQDGATLCQRTGNSLVAYKNRYLVMFGGFRQGWPGGASNHLYIYDLEEHAWLRVKQDRSQALVDEAGDVPNLSDRVVEVSGEWPQQRDKHSAVLDGDRMLVFGGWGSDARPSEGYEFLANDMNMCYWNNTLYSLDLTNLEQGNVSWSLLQPRGCLPSPRAGHSAVVLERTMYIIAGRTHTTRTSSIHPFDLRTNTWLPEMHLTVPTPFSRRSWQTATVFAPHKVFIHGGLPSEGHDHTLSDAYILDFKEETSICLGSSIPLRWHTSIAWNHKVFLFGGVVDGTWAKSHHLVVYDFTPNTLLQECIRVAAREGVDHSALPKKLQHAITTYRQRARCEQVA
eukprot:m.225432 g.225432  ORF g.225432 m.225432 type:complete len:408 (+) comp15158_c1_seq1:163-1386(+)